MVLAINHATLATAGVLGLSIYTGERFFLPLLVFVVFASLLPDIDHPGSEMSQMIPIVNKAFKHRGITHSIFGILLFGVIVNMILGFNIWVSYVLIVVAFMGVYFLEEFMVRRVTSLHKLTNGFISRKQTKLGIKLLSGLLYGSLILTSLLIWQGRLRQEILVLSVLGCFLHTVGDFVTKEGVPLLWPIKTKFGLKLFRTGSVAEGLIGGLLAIANVFLLIEFWTLFDVSSMEYWNHYIGL